MISVICVYHTRDMLNRVLLESLGHQDPHELILLDNTEGKWKSAASALNQGARVATGKYLMFVHQDVELTPNYLGHAERLLDTMTFGVAGAIGMSEEGRTYEERLRGFISNAGQGWGKPITEPQKVQTLDELLLIVPRATFLGFDEKTFDHWHCYGCDYALTMNELGLGAYVIPGYVYHRSLATNVANLRTYHKRLFYKHHKHFARIHATTNGLTWLSILTLPELLLAIRVNRWLFPNWLEIAKKELKGCRTILDVGCGYNSPIQYFGVPLSVGVEVHEPYLAESRKKAIHTQYVQGNILDYEWPDKSFDAVFASEVLEHMSHAAGEELLTSMEKWARKKVVLTTPNGFVWQDGYDHNPYQQHLSAWTPSELRERGYRVQGMSGLKAIRGYKGQLTIKPEILGMRVADISQKFTRYVPSLAFQLLAVKNV